MHSLYFCLSLIEFQSKAEWEELQGELPWVRKGLSLQSCQLAYSMVSWTQIPEEIELVSSEILARQVCNLGKIVYQTQMVRTQNVALKHLYLHVLWGTSLARTYLGYPKPLDLDVTSTNWQNTSTLWNIIATNITVLHGFMWSW